MSGIFKVREYICWWNMGVGVYFGVISKMDEIVIKYYVYLFVLLYDIEFKVDLFRLLLVE